jgi:lipocalin
MMEAASTSETPVNFYLTLQPGRQPSSKHSFELSKYLGHWIQLAERNVNVTRSAHTGTS